MILTLGTVTVLKAQDIHFANVQRMAQWYNASLKMDKEHEVLMNFRDIRYQNALAFQTGTTLVNLSLLNKSERESEFHRSYANVTLGASFDQSNGGLYKNNVSLFGLSYAVNMNGRGLYMAAGFQGAFTNTRFGMNGVFQDQFDQYGPIAGSTSADPMRTGRTYRFFSLNAGWSLFSKSQNFDWYTGLSLRHVNQPFTEETKSPEYKKPTVFGMQAGMTLKTAYSTVDLFALVNLKAKANEWIGGVRYNFLLGENSLGTSTAKHNVVLGVGCLYRLKDAMIPELQLTVGKTGIGLHYDMNTSGIRSGGFTRRGFELQLTQKL